VQVIANIAGIAAAKKGKETSVHLFPSDNARRGNQVQEKCENYKFRVVAGWPTLRVAELDTRFSVGK